MEHQNNKRDLNEVLKEREALARLEKQDGPMKLDDAARVKVLSPGMLVFKRFIRNKLAIIGAAILLFMFVFAFVGPLLYPYGQTEAFYKYDTIHATYASATQRTEYTAYQVNETLAVDDFVLRALGSGISAMEKQEQTESYLSGKNGVSYLLRQLGEGVYEIAMPNLTTVATFAAGEEIGTYRAIGKQLERTDGAVPETGFVDAIAQAVVAKAESFAWEGATYGLKSQSKTEYLVTRTGVGPFTYQAAAMDAGFELAAAEAVTAGQTAFSYQGTEYSLISPDSSAYEVAVEEGAETAYVASTLVFDGVTAGTTFSEELKGQALLALYGGGSFRADGQDYQIALRDDEAVITQGGADVAILSNVAVRDVKGNDVFDRAFKDAVSGLVLEMEAAGTSTAHLLYQIPEKITQIDEDGNEKIVTVTDENGNVVYEDTDFLITRKTGQYVLSCNQIRYLIDINAAPTWSHPFGTDGDGYDVLARMMYGGRISLMVGFVVVILEVLLGVILGGVAGYFGGWVDNLVMRLVDVFYCIPSTPLLIIMGSFMDAMKLTPYVRLVWMMAILGFLGWASVARLVRGQILSLREQEFMVATEATGISIHRRIFRHLVPNVMPQLIVFATMGLGAVILTESTLSFLGLGVKHPLATWGTMIYNVTQSNENMIKFTYIWVPVGLLICLTVVAFNFVGDGLRDAFDPKMKR